MSLAAVGDDGTDIPSRQEAEQLLDDPNPRGEIQRGFALRYLDYVEEDPTAYGFRDEADFNAFKEKYKERLSISDGDLFRSVAGAEDDVRLFYTKAKEDHDQLRADARQGDRDAVNGGASALEAVRGRSSETDPGAANSNEILDAGVSGLRAFDVWLPLYNRAVALNGGGAAVTIEEIYRLYDEQRDIPFDKFGAGAGEFEALRDAIASSSADVAGRLQSTFSSWEGAAADRARQYEQGYAEQTSAVAESIGTAAEGLRHTVGSVGQFCQEKANWVLTYYFDSINGVTAQDMERLVRVAEGNGSQNDIIHCIGFMGIEAKNRFNDDWGGLDQDTVDFIVEQAGVWLGEVFCAWFGEHLGNYRMMCENIRVAVDGAWNAFPEMISRIPENPYSGIGAAGTPPQPQQAGPAPAAGPSVGPAAGMTAAPESAPGVTAPASTVPTPSTPAPDAQSPSAPAPAVPAPTVPASSVSEAEARPEIPATEPDSGRQNAQSESNVLTISHGDYEISLSLPDGEGAMEITLDDGTGQPKEFALDFGAKDVEHDTEPGAVDPVAPNSAPQADQPHRPGADGRIHVEDGSLRVVAEQPEGPKGGTVLTVDDGMGEPVTYTLGAGERTAEPLEQPDAAQSTTPQSVSGLSEVAEGAAFADVSRGAMVDEPDSGVPASGTDGAPERQATPGAGLGTAPGGFAPVDGEQNTSAVGGAGMMGGAGGAAGGSGADQERNAGAFRVEGNIFDTAGLGDRISGTLGLDDDPVTGQQSNER